MNARRSAERLPESMRRLVLSDPSVRARADLGMELGDIVSNAGWAKDWFRRCQDNAQIEILKFLLVRYGTNPFEPERLEERAEEEFGLTGAEFRVALAKLRRSGILFAVRKIWGDKLIYLPDDAVPLWQPILFPAGVRPLSSEEACDVEPSMERYRSPLALELLSAWHEIARQPLSFTAKGAPHRADVARIAETMMLPADNLEELRLAYPHSDRLPPQLALAIDIGLVCGLLIEDESAIGVCAEGMRSWLALPYEEADDRLRRLVLSRYCSAKPKLHMTVSAVLSLDGEGWHTQGRIDEWGDRGETDKRLALLEAFGWIERGRWRGQAVLRRRTEFDGGDSLDGEGCSFILQPDGEVFVPPEVGLSARWKLLDVAELKTADSLYVYRLTRRSCEEAYRIGYSLQDVVAFLERGSEAPLPEPAEAALRDWFASIGRTELVQALLLRADSAEIAELLSNAPDFEGMLLERIGDRHFLVDALQEKRIRDQLKKAGFPPAERMPDRMRQSQGASESSREHRETEKGWIVGKPSVSVFEAERGWGGADDFFPGLGDIPAAWVTKPREYHPSTSKELIKRAIQWRTSVRLEPIGGKRAFAPVSIREEGARWVAEGRWIEPGNGANRGAEFHPDAVRSEEIAEVMIVLPDLEELETD